MAHRRPAPWKKRTPLVFFRRLECHRLRWSVEMGIVGCVAVDTDRICIACRWDKEMHTDYFAGESLPIAVPVAHRVSRANGDNPLIDEIRAYLARF